MQDSFSARMQGQAPIQAPNPKQKTGRGWMVLSIILIVIMIGAGVFGGMIILKGQRDTNRLSEVENELKKKDEDIEYLKKVVEDELIRLGDTGIYLKYPTTISELSYTVNNGFSTYPDSIVGVSFTGYKKEGDKKSQNKLYFANISEWSLGDISILKKDENNYTDCETLKEEEKDCNSDYPYEDEEYYVIYNSPQNIFSDDEENKKIELETTKVLKQWLTNPKNYIKKK